MLEDFYNLEESLQLFANEPGHGNIFNQDEYAVASELKSAIAAKEFARLTQIMRKPIFGFIEIEVVKLLKRWAANPPAHVLAMAPLTEGGIAQSNEEIKAPVTKDQALDNLLL
mgnify:CR=1 FL=1